MPARDEYFGVKDDVTAPITAAVAVTPSDTTDLNYLTRAIYVGGGGDLTVVMANGVTVTFSAVPAGTMLPIRVNRVRTTGTSATLIVALW